MEKGGGLDSKIDTTSRTADPLSMSRANSGNHWCILQSSGGCLFLTSNLNALPKVEVCGRASGDKIQITRANAAASMVIFKGERLNAEYTKNQVPNTMECRNGWIDSGLFYLRLCEVFKEYTTHPSRDFAPRWPLNSLYTWSSARSTTGGRDYNLSSPNTTYAAQPLDVSFFRPLKNWSTVSYVCEWKSGTFWTLQVQNDLPRVDRRWILQSWDMSI